MAASDARPIPWKGTAYRVTFPIYDADGDLVTAAASLDSEVSLDGGSFADCTNEAVEIAAGSGMYFLDLTAAEMTADTVAVIVKTATAGAKTTPLVMYPQEGADIRVDVTHFGGSAGSFSAGRPEINVTRWNGSPPNDLASGRVDASVGEMQSAVIVSGAFAAGAINAAAIATDAIGAAEFSQAAADKVWASATRTLTASAALPANGLDSVVIETGLNARQALAIIASACAGVLTGVGTPTITILGAGVVTQRISAQVDANNNRVVVTPSPPA